MKPPPPSIEIRTKADGGGGGLDDTGLSNLERSWKCLEQKQGLL